MRECGNRYVEGMKNRKIKCEYTLRELFSLFAYEGTVVTRTSEVSSDRTPNALQKAVKTCALSTVGPSKSPESGEARDVSVDMSAQLPFKALVYYCPRKRVITTGHLLD